MLKLTLTTLAAVFIVLAVWGQPDEDLAASPGCGVACAQSINESAPDPNKTGALIVPIEYAPTLGPEVLRPAPGKPAKP
ncbi:hypothetical protein OE699_12155 [Sedimentimonas flavescens]|uniref:Secreted protein n=1 Tax=Sedimentimonas flavescens TaxID=2851012 RepID=A0ABT3A1X6_9RHOB|nr:hypothetical protein [Sedimentimonas flavescens]MBW0158997.1 hypothetical protein [Sedimentimonas flavescens]MCT2540396.1 hypothetical protein [Sedimentimonas flavescens]MCV2879600.1 hypothetical protein [Sedimentimonas flavescens]